MAMSTIEWHQYASLMRFILPLLLTIVAMDIGELALNRGLSSSTHAVCDLASFGIAYKIVQLFTGAIEDFKMISVVLLHSKKDKRKILICAAFLSGGALVVLLLLGLTQLGELVINNLHSVNEEVGRRTRNAIMYFCAYPAIDSLAWIHTGILIQQKYTVAAGFASIADMGAQVLTIVVALQTSATDFLAVSVGAVYLGQLVRLCILFSTYYIYVHKQLPEEQQGNRQTQDTDVSNDNCPLQGGIIQNGAASQVLTFKQIVRMWAPLACVRLAQKLSRPFCNIMVARDRSGGRTEQDAIKSIAALSVTYPIAHVPYGFMMELRSIEPTFRKKDSERPLMEVATIRSFCMLIGLLSFVLMNSLFWTPGVSTAILIAITNVPQDIASLCVVPLKIFAFIPIPTTARAIFTGWFLKEKQTKYLYPSAFVRFSFTVVALICLPKLGVYGSDHGAGSFFIGYLSSCIMVTIAYLWLYHCRWWSCGKDVDAEVAISADADDYKDNIPLTPETRDNVQMERTDILIDKADFQVENLLSENGEITKVGLDYAGDDHNRDLNTAL